MSINHDDFDQLADKVLGDQQPDDTGTGRPAGRPDDATREAYAEAQAEERAATARQAAKDLDSGIMSSSAGGYTDDGPVPVLAPARSGGPSDLDKLTRGPAGWTLDELGTRPDEHSVAPPAELQAAWADVESTVTHARRAIEDLRSVDVDRRRAEVDHERRIEAAARSGESAPAKSRARDWGGEQRAAAARARGLIARAKDARVRYDQLATATLAGPDRVQQLEAALAQAHAEALAAVSEAEGKARAVQVALDALVSAAQNADTQLQVRPGSTLNTPKVSQHLQDASAELQRLDPQTRKILVQIPAGAMSLTDRLAISQSSHHEWRYQLQQQERAEDYAITDYTRGWPPLERPLNADDRWLIREGFARR